MKHRRPFAAALSAVVVSVALCAAPLRSAHAAGADEAIGAAGVAAGWCARGATFAVLFSAAFSVPNMVLGGGPGYSLGRAGAAALMGCGVAVTWRSFARGVAYIDEIINPMPPVPADPPPRRIPASSRPSFIHTSL